jgi:membrane protein YqaA with SNARE-associated domain
MPRGGERPGLAESHARYRRPPKSRQTRRIGAARASRTLRRPVRRAICAPQPKLEAALPEPLYAGLFLSALLAATVLPGVSEILMLGLLVQGLDAWTLWLVATVGNVIGSTLNWWLGRFALRFSDRRWFPVSRDALARAQGWFRRWGQPSLLLSWLPGIGDAFTVAAGVMRAPLLPFLAMVAIAKGGRYAAVLGAGQGMDIAGWF